MSPASPESDRPAPPGRLERWFHPLDRMSIHDERIALIVQALLVALVLSWAKWFLHRIGFEPVATLPLITAILGGVVFTLAILLAATLQDYKESERIVGELASNLRRLHWDLAHVRADAKLLREADDHLLRLVRIIRDDLRQGANLSLAKIHPAIANLDVVLQRLTEGGKLPIARTAQIELGHVVRIVDRLDVIIATTFSRAGYYFAGVVTVGAILVLGLAHLEPFWQGLILFGFSAFLLVGLFLLIWDMDNPFSGHARISIFQFDQLEAFYAGVVEASRPTPAVEVTA